MRSFQGLHHLSIELAYRGTEINGYLRAKGTDKTREYGWRLAELLVSHKNTLRSIYLRCRCEREDYSHELNWLAHNCPLLTDIGVPFPAITKAISDQGFDLSSSAKALASRLQESNSLQHLYLVTPYLPRALRKGGPVEVLLEATARASVEQEDRAAGISHLLGPQSP